MSKTLDYTAIAEGVMDALRGELYAYAGEVEGWEKATTVLADYLGAEFGKRIAELEAALRPFSLIWRFADIEGRPDDMIMYQHGFGEAIRLGDVRRAIQALAETEGP